MKFVPNFVNGFPTAVICPGYHPTLTFIILFNNTSGDTQQIRYFHNRYTRISFIFQLNVLKILQTLFVFMNFEMSLPLQNPSLFVWWWWWEDGWGVVESRMLELWWLGWLELGWLELGWLGLGWG